MLREKNKFRINWSGRAFDYSREEMRAVFEVVASADPLTQGKYLQQFEKDFSEYTGLPHCFAVSNCTNALDLVAILSGIGKGDEVIVPAHTFCASAIPFARTGARIRWADIELDTRVVSAETIQRVITKKTRLIVVVHLYGLMAKMDDIISLADRHKCLVVEDCAQALGARYRDKPAGSFGDFSAFSFQGQKNLTTLGEGGVVGLKEKRLAKKVPGLRHNGIRNFTYRRDHYWIPAMTNVDMDIAGIWPYNFCLSEVQCAVGSAVLKRIDRMNELRIKRALFFQAAVKNFPELSFQKVSLKHKHVYHLLSAMYDKSFYGSSRDDFIKFMAYKYRIKTIVQYYPLYRYPLFKKMGLEKADCPNTDRFFDNMVSFPFHHWMSDNDFDYMLSSTIKAINLARRK